MHKNRPALEPGRITGRRHSLAITMRRYHRQEFAIRICIYWAVGILVILFALLSAACSAPPTHNADSSVSQTPFPRSMKGYELYSWQTDGEWHFTLITGTNRNKTLEEVTAGESQVTGDGWARITVQGAEALRSILGQVPPGESIFWVGALGIEPASSGDPILEMPPQEIVAEIQAHCRTLGLDLQAAGENRTR